MEQLSITKDIMKNILTTLESFEMCKVCPVSNIVNTYIPVF